MHEHLQKFDTMPEGWKRDYSFGSPLYGHVPIHNGISVINGGKKGLLKLSDEEINSAKMKVMK